MITLKCTTLSLIVVLLCCYFVSKTECSDIKAAPYYMPLDNSPQSIDDIVANSGIRHFIFAFVLATNEGECVPTWDGNKTQTVAADQVVLGMVNKVRQHGGDISISFGGYNGVELGHVCKTPEELARAYQTVIDKYQLTHVDFDIEGDDLGPEGEENRRFEAIKILRKNAATKGKELHVTLTLPCTTVGLSDLGKAEIKRAIAAQSQIDLYKIMAFDYGGPAASQAESVVQVMEMVHAQLKALRTDLTTDQQIYSHTGMILMNGHTDQPSELYTLDTFRKLLEYAKSKNLGRLSYWSLNRDRPCPTGETLGWAAGKCSSLAQKPYDYTKIVAQFEGNTNTNNNPDNHHNNEGHITPTTAPVVQTTSKPQVTSAPQPAVDCRNTHGEQYFPYQNDCHKYIRCFGGAAHDEVCPSGTLFDLNLHICNWATNVHRPECKN